MSFRLTGARRVSFAAAICAVALFLPGAAFGSTGVSPTEGVQADVGPGEPITMEVKAINGSGCPLGTATVRAEPDNSGFRVIYHDFSAQDGGSAAPTDIRRFCQINVLVHIPHGFTIALASAENRGRISLQKGATALVRTNYYLTGSSANNFENNVFTGPLGGAWRTLDVAPVVDLVFAPCGKNINVNLHEELQVNAGTSTKLSSISMRRTEADVDTFLNFQWKTC